MLRTRDRLVAVVAAAVGAAALLLTAAFVESPSTPAELFANDPAAQRDLLALVAAGERAAYLVEYTSARVLAAGESRAERMVEARLPPRRVVVASTTAVVDIGDDRTRCTATDVGAQCLPEERPSTLAASEVYRTALDEGIYAVRETGGRNIAGEEARCFELAAVRGLLPDLGLIGERCFAADGIPLATRVADALVDDRRTALVVRRDVAVEDLTALLDRFAAGSGDPVTS